MQMQLVRLGACNNCGDCCRHNDPFRGLPVQCMFYQEHGTGHCKIYLTRPDVCRKYPLAPRDVACLKGCGYQFMDEKGENIDMYMLNSTRAHLNVAVQRRRLLAQSNSRRGNGANHF